MRKYSQIVKNILKDGANKQQEILPKGLFFLYIVFLGV